MRHNSRHELNAGGMHKYFTLLSGWRTRACEQIQRDYRRLLETGFFHVVVVTFGVRGAGFVQQIGLARILDPEELGMAVFVLRVLTIICVVADLGISTSLLKFSAEPVSEEQKNTIYRTSVAAVARVSFLTALIFTLIVLFSGGLGREELLLPLIVGALFIPASSLRKLPPLYLQAQKRIKQASMISGSMHLVILTLILLGAYSFRFWGYLVVMIAGQGLILGVFLYVTRTALSGVRTDWSLFKGLANFGFFSMLANFSGIINASLGVLMLNWLGSGYEEIAIFGIATVVVGGLRLVPQSLLRTAFPFLVSVINQPHQLKQKVDEIVLKQGAIVIMLALAFGLLGYWMLPLLFGAHYQASWPPMVILLFSLVFWAIGAAFGQLQLVLNLVKLNFAISITQLLINFALAYLFIPEMGAVGAAAALCLSYLAHTFLLIISGSRSLKALLDKATPATEEV